MKKITLLLIATLCALALVGCSSNSLPSSPPSEPPVNTAEPSSAPTEPSIQSEAPQQEPSQSAGVPSPAPTEPETPELPQGDNVMPTVNIQVGDRSFIVILHDNESARTIIEEMPFTLEMDDYASQEKVTALSFVLPSARTEAPATINAGELYLWSANNLVLFYTTFSNSYSYVPIGYIEDVTGLRDALGSGSVKIAFSVSE